MALLARLYLRAVMAVLALAVAVQTAAAAAALLVRIVAMGLLAALLPTLVAVLLAAVVAALAALALHQAEARLALAGSIIREQREQAARRVHQAQAPRLAALDRMALAVVVVALIPAQAQVQLAARVALGPNTLSRLVAQ